MAHIMEDSMISCYNEEIAINLASKIDRFLGTGLSSKDLLDDLNDNSRVDVFVRRLSELQGHKVTEVVEKFSLPEYKDCEMTRKEKIDVLVAYKASLISQCFAMIIYQQNQNSSSK